VLGRGHENYQLLLDSCRVVRVPSAPPIVGEVRARKDCCNAGHLAGVSDDGGGMRGMLPNLPPLARLVWSDYL